MDVRRFRGAIEQALPGGFHCAKPGCRKPGHLNNEHPVLSPPVRCGQPGWSNDRQMNLNKQSRCRAFTLVEIMIAIAIFSIVVAAIDSNRKNNFFSHHKTKHEQSTQTNE